MGNGFPEVYETIGKRIKAFRKKLNITQTELSKLVGVSPQVVSNWERDYTSPNHEYISKLTNVLGVSADYILVGFDYKTINQAAENNEVIMDAINSFYHKYGDAGAELIGEILEDKNIDLQKLLESNVNISFKGEILKKNERKKIGNIISVMLNES